MVTWPAAGGVGTAGLTAVCDPPVWIVGSR